MTLPIRFVASGSTTRKNIIPEKRRRWRDGDQLELEIDHNEDLDHWAVGRPRSWFKNLRLGLEMQRTLLAQFRCRIQLRYSQTIGGERWEE